MFWCVDGIMMICLFYLVDFTPFCLLVLFCLSVFAFLFCQVPVKI